MVLFSRSFIRKRVISVLTTATVAVTSFALARERMPASHGGARPIQYVANRLNYSAEQPCPAENVVAINRMMTAEMTVEPTGDIDRDFVAMMVPHDRGAIDMAKAELRYGHNQQLRRLAGEIATAQGQEIVLMRQAIGEDAVLAPAQPGTMVSSMKSDGAAARGSTSMN